RFISHSDAAVRIQALQLADHWFARAEGRALLDAALIAAAAEPNPRVQIQFALSLGETRDPGAFAMLARFARERLGVRWMDAAVLSSLHGRGLEMLGMLLREPAGSAPFLPPLAQSIAARRDESELASALNLVATAKPDTQAAVLNSLALKHGHELFRQACATCHRIGNEGNEMGPDLLGQLGIAEESLLKDLLMPNERIRPGYETTLVQTRDGGAVTGLLKNDGATSL